MSETFGRMIIVSDLDADGARRPVLVTADPAIVEAVERALRARIGCAWPGGDGQGPAPLSLLKEDGDGRTR